MSQLSAALTSSGPPASVVLGHTVPRLWTPPLRILTPDTSYGYELIEFAAAIGYPLDAWQQWLAIHMGEELPDGRPRFRMVLALVARQNGKTRLARVLTLYWLHIQRARLVLGTSTSRETAKESWSDVCDIALDPTNDVLAGEYGPKALRLTIGEEALVTLDGCRYQFAAPNRRAGRSKTVHRIVLDELREHQRWDTYNAAVKAMTAVPDGQCIAITNQGDDTAVVLDSLRDSALAYIDTSVGDPRLGLFEWSAPAGSDVADPEAIAWANPDLNRSGRIILDSIIGDALRAKQRGGEELAGYKTETLCMRVTLLDPAIDPDLWDACRTPDAQLPDLAKHRDRTALCLDVALDGSHATLMAAALIDGLVHLEVVKAWNGHGAAAGVRADLPAIVQRIRPRSLGWFPGGPAAAIAADLKARKGNRLWPPRRVEIVEITDELAAVCMGFDELVRARGIGQPGDEMLTGQVRQTQKLKRGDRWTFTRAGATPIDASYAGAGAAHLARILPPPRPPLQVV